MPWISSFLVTIVVLKDPGLAVEMNDDIERVGNPIIPSDKGLNYVNTTFLVADMVLQDGLLFAYSAYLRALNPVRFQIWRPSDFLQRRFRLLFETRFVPSDKNRRMDLYIRDTPNGKCVPVQAGDRVGIFIEAPSSSVAHVFDDENPVAFTYHVKGGDRFAEIGDEVQFDFLAFPFTFSVSAYIHKDLSKYIGQKEPPCPIGLAIPPFPGDSGHGWTMGATGATGATGIQGIPGKAGPYGHTGAEGPMGPRGPPGERGARGPMGPPGPPRLAAGGTSHAGTAGHSHVVPAAQNPHCACLEKSSLFHSNVILGLIVWLTAMSILNMAYICYSCCKLNFLPNMTAQAQNQQNSWTERVRESVKEYNTKRGAEGGVQFSNL